MCMKPEAKVDESTTQKVEAILTAKESEAIAPTHSALERNTKYDWLLFLAPALFYKVTPVWPLYTIAIARIISTHLILSLHWQFVDKDNYLNKLTRKQLKREKQEYLTAYYMHMWTQVALQLIFPSLFFADNSEIWACAKETFWCHVLLVEPLYYAVHRWLHIPKWMKMMHGFHHLSINTLPTTSLCQNVLEHVVYIATFGPAFLVPFALQQRQHWVVIGGYLLAFDIVNAWGHTNVRVRNPIFTSKYSPVKYLFYTPEFHLGHHALFTANYALFMPVWDYLFGSYREYEKKDIELLPKNQQDFVFIGHNGGLGHFFTIPELNFYNVYDDYIRTWLPLKMEFLIMHVIAQVYRLWNSFYYCSRFCIANEYIGRIICLSRTPYDYIYPNRYDGVNREIVQLIKQEYQRSGTRYFGLGNLNKMKQLNDGGKEIVRLVEQDEFLKDKKIRIWTGDTMTVASVYHQILDIPDLDSFFFIGAGGKIGTAVCEMLVKARPHLKIRIFSRNHYFDHPNISYSNDLSEMANYKVVLVGKILSQQMYANAMNANKDNAIKTRFVLNYTVPAFPIDALTKRHENVRHIRIGLLKTRPKNPFLKGHYDLCMSHDENHIVPCHFGCLLHTVNGRETHEVGEIDQNDVERLWQMGRARGFQNIIINYDE